MLIWAFVSTCVLAIGALGLARLDHAASLMQKLSKLNPLITQRSGWEDRVRVVTAVVLAAMCVVGLVSVAVLLAT